MSDIKICSECKIQKELTEFSFRNDTKKYKSQCKICINIISKNWYINNKEKHLLKGKEWRLNNLEKSKEYQIKYKLNNQEKIKNSYLQNKEKYNLKHKEYYLQNKEKIITHNTNYRLKNIEKYKQNNKEYRLKNIEKLKEYNKIYKKERKLTDPLFKLKYTLGTLIRNCIRNNGYSKKSKTNKILGCTFEEFKQHLERQFIKGMTWENSGEWHLDHIYPVSLAKDEEELIRLNHYTNFQPLWAKENIQKSNKIIDNKQLILI